LVLSGITRYHEGSKKHLDNLFSWYFSLGIKSSGLGIKLYCIRKYMSKIYPLPNLLCLILLIQYQNKSGRRSRASPGVDLITLFRHKFTPSFYMLHNFIRIINICFIAKKRSRSQKSVSKFKFTSKKFYVIDTRPCLLLYNEPKPRTVYNCDSQQGSSFCVKNELRACSSPRTRVCIHNTLFSS
jgi:hypothetical protein